MGQVFLNCFSWFLGLSGGLFLFLPQVSAVEKIQTVQFIKHRTNPEGTSGTYFKYLKIEVLEDDLLHFEYSVGRPKVTEQIPISPYVDQVNYPGRYHGARVFLQKNTSLETAALKVELARDSLCLRVADKRLRRPLTEICPGEGVGLKVARGEVTDVFGLGEQFLGNQAGEPNGNWIEKERTPGDQFGNFMPAFQGGFTGNAQFPVLFAVGSAATKPLLNYTLFVDHVHKMKWDLRGAEWKVDIGMPLTKGQAPALRFFVMGGKDLPELRQKYMGLVGRPLVPPKKAFGLWVSQYGFVSWDDVRDKLKTLREHHFPVDGFVLDLQWFGGIRQDENTSMGKLIFDEKNFPQPAKTIREFRENEGIGFMTIEESYVGRGLHEHGELETRGFLARKKPNSNEAFFINNPFPWWGVGGMIDWSNPQAGLWWHDQKRQPLVVLGVMGHWTDLGEPEMYSDKDRPGATPFYFGSKTQADVQNIYSLLWHKSIYEGYERNHNDQRPWILSRSGGSGVQRYGAGMWSGDIGSNFGSLAAQMNVQMQMSFSGVDYFGSDIGGFHREGIAIEPGTELNDLYSKWFADSCVLDVPVRPHTENVDRTKETAPDRVGDLASNLVNLRLRYELSPYYYSLAHRAHLLGEPVMPPLAYYYQDSAPRALADEKMLGRDLLFVSLFRAAEKKRDVFLPPGGWFDFRSGEFYQSSGSWLRGFPVERDGRVTAPVFARAGAIVPMMYVDDLTMNIEGKRSDGSSREELMVRAFSGGVGEESQFTLFEDDGKTNAYRKGDVAKTFLRLRVDGDSGLSPDLTHLTLLVEPTVGQFQGQLASRRTVVEFVDSGINEKSVISAELNGSKLVRLATREELDKNDEGFVILSSVHRIILKSKVLNIRVAKEFVLHLRYDRGQ
jgi:alpha-glucosidase (family GH31 glycosyl hydrolase)